MVLLTRIANFELYPDQTKDTPHLIVAYLCIMLCYDIAVDGILWAKLQSLPRSRL